jgi:hypothetical protein
VSVGATPSAERVDPARPRPRALRRSLGPWVLSPNCLPARETSSARTKRRLDAAGTPLFAGALPRSADGDRTLDLLRPSQTARTTEQCRFAGLSKRLMGLEPTTFCVASRPCSSVPAAFSLHVGHIGAFAASASVSGLAAFRRSSGTQLALRRGRADVARAPSGALATATRHDTSQWRAAVAG